MQWQARHSSEKSRKGREGFTLIEVIIAMGILAFGILAIASMQTSSLGGTSFSGGMTEATTVAMDRLEVLMTRPYTHADLTNGEHGPFVQDGNTVRWTVTNNQLLNNTKTIAVTVQYRDKSLSLTYVKMDVI
jgi:prepilin-type N-terminal cleavage/methylation domain-containing protein